MGAQKPERWSRGWNGDSGVSQRSSRQPQAIAGGAGWWSLEGYAALLYQRDQVREDRPPGRRAEPGIEPDINRRDHGGDGFIAPGKPLKDGSRALVAMRDEGADMRVGIGDRRAMRRPVRGIVAVEQLRERAQIGIHVAIRRRDDAGRPAHDVIAGEEDFLLVQRETQMVRGMAGRMHRGHPPALPLDDFAVAQGPVGDEIAIGAFLAAGAVAACRAMRAEAERRRGGGALQRARGRRTIEMGMGSEYVGYRLAGERLEPRVDKHLH